MMLTIQTFYIQHTGFNTISVNILSPLSHTFFKVQNSVLYAYIFKYIFFIDFLQKGRERDRELETLMREKYQSAASCTLLTGDVPATKVHALDWNQTRDPSVRRLMLYPLSQTGFGSFCILNVSVAETGLAQWIERQPAD